MHLRRLCSDLRSYGFQLAAAALDGTEHELLRSALGDKSDKDVSYFSFQPDNVEAGLQDLSKQLASKTITLSISCIDSRWWKESIIAKDEKTSVLGQGYEPHGLFVGVQRTLLPHLTRNSPAALLVVSDTCIPSADPSKAALAKFLEVSTLPAA